MSDYPSGPVRDDRSRIGRVISLGGCAGRLGFLLGCGGAAIGILVAVLAVFFPNVLSGTLSKLMGVPLPATAPITGSANAYDPIASFGSVNAFAGSDAQLISLTATSVRVDGTLDLTATYSPAPDVDYQFVHKVPRPANAPPVGAGSTGPGAWYEPIRIRVYQPGQRRNFYYASNGISASMDYVNEGMEKQLSDPTTILPGDVVDSPRCAFADLWKTALARGAPSDAVATISYSLRGYSFSITALSIHLSFDLDCRLEG